MDHEESLAPEDQKCEDHFKSTHKRDSTGRSSLPSKNAQAALCRDKTYSQLYRQFMTEYEQLNHMVKVPENVKIKSSLYYLPHHGVLRPERETTKLRVVFNGSSSSTSGYSVNDLMYAGGNLHLDISDVLIWIRHHRHIFATEITKMFRQINIHEDDWDLQRILWIDDKLNAVPYYLTTVTYGTKAAPFLAVRTLLQLVEDEGHRFPLAVPSFLKLRYVDDLIEGSDTGEELIKTARQLILMCKAGGLPLAKWQSTHPELLKSIAVDQTDTTISFDDCTTKILGLKWSAQEDKFTFSTKNTVSSEKLTKRLILSEVAQIYLVSSHQ